MLIVQHQILLFNDSRLCYHVVIRLHRIHHGLSTSLLNICNVPGGFCTGDWTRCLTMFQFCPRRLRRRHWNLAFMASRFLACIFVRQNLVKVAGQLLGMSNYTANALEFGELRVISMDKTWFWGGIAEHRHRWSSLRAATLFVVPVGWTNSKLLVMVEHLYHLG